MKGLDDPGVDYLLAGRAEVLPLIRQPELHPGTRRKASEQSRIDAEPLPTHLETIKGLRRRVDYQKTRRSATTEKPTYPKRSKSLGFFGYSAFLFPRRYRLLFEGTVNSPRSATSHQFFLYICAGLAAEKDCNHNPLFRQDTLRFTSATIV